jgi:hypothetical protein
MPKKFFNDKNVVKHCKFDQLVVTITEIENLLQKKN